MRTEEGKEEKGGREQGCNPGSLKVPCLVDWIWNQADVFHNYKIKIIQNDRLDKPAPSNTPHKRKKKKETPLDALLSLSESPAHLYASGWNGVEAMLLCMCVASPSTGQ